MSYADQHPSEQESQAGRLKGKAIRRGRLLLCCVHTQPHIQPHKKKKRKRGNCFEVWSYVSQLDGIEKMSRCGLWRKRGPIPIPLGCSMRKLGSKQASNQSSNRW
jgi:hypothetical protein